MAPKVLKLTFDASLPVEEEEVVGGVGVALVQRKADVESPELLRLDERLHALLAPDLLVWNKLSYNIFRQRDWGGHDQAKPCYSINKTELLMNKTFVTSGQTFEKY